MTADDYEAAVNLIVRPVERHRGRMTTEACRAEQVGIIGKAILRGTYPLGNAVDAAIGGDPYADRALRQIARECLSTGVLPDHLVRFVDHVLGAAGPANFPKGRHSLNFWSRNSTIRMLVEETMAAWKVNATRNEATDEPAAASIVSDALKRCGIDIGEKQVGEIFRSPLSAK